MNAFSERGHSAVVHDRLKIEPSLYLASFKKDIESLVSNPEATSREEIEAQGRNERPRHTDRWVSARLIPMLCGSTKIFRTHLSPIMH